MSSSNPQDPPVWRGGHWGVAVGWAVLLALHVGLFAHFGGLELWSSTPYFGHDFNTHIGQTWRFLEAMEGWGETWVYDARLLAGTPNGVFFDADNKGWEVWTYLGTRLGMSRGAAFNSFVVAAHAGVPLAVGWSARRFGLSPGGALTAAWGASLLWFFDSWNHWCWYVGMVAYAFASYAFLIPLAAYWRWLQTRRGGWWVLATASLSLSHLLHPYTFFMLAPPMLAWTWWRRGSLERRGLLWAVGMAAVTIVSNGWWLSVAAQFWHYILDSAYFGGGGLSFVAADLAGLMIDPASTGLLGTRTVVRWLILALGFLGLRRWRARGDDRRVGFGAVLWVLLPVAYLGTYTPLEQVQPYRHVGPLGFAACIPAGAVVAHWCRTRVLRGLPDATRPIVGVLALAACLGLVREAMYFVGGRLPAPKLVPGTTFAPLDMSGHGWTPHYGYARVPMEPAVEWIEANDDGRGRFLVEGPLFGEFFAWQTNAQIIGGFTQRNVRHAWSNLFRWRPLGRVSSEELRKYVDTYAIHFVIVTTSRHEAPWWDEHPSVLRLTQTLGLWRIYRVLQPTGLIQDGPGEVRAATNTITVTGSDPGRAATLRYQWLETLACRPDCQVRPVPVEGRRAPLIEVPAPHPADFEVYNAYEDTAARVR